jgi:hypothetical protein
MRRLAILLGISLAACGGGGGSSSQQLSTQQLLEQCLATDLADLSTLLTTLQGLLDQDGTGLQPQFNLVEGLLTGKVPWTLDLDGDAAPDLSGEVFLTDVNGAVTFPPPTLVQVLTGGGAIDLDTVLAALPDGTKLNLTYLFADLTLLHGASGSGSLGAEVQGQAVSDVSGSGTFTGDCEFDFDLDGLSPDVLGGGGLGQGSLSFGIGSGKSTATGSIVLDGTNTARITASRPGQPVENFVIDLATGVVQPG